MNEYLFMLIFFIFVIIVHEIGHILMFVLFTKKFPPIVINWSGIFVGSAEYNGELTPLMMVAVALGGLVIGSIPFLAYPNLSILIVYILMSSIDIFWVVYGLSLKDEYGDIPLKFLKITVKS